MNAFIKTGVIGHPISHSKSPLIHNYWIEKYGLSGEYSAIDIPCEALETGVQKLVEQGYAGFNLTLPHKELIMPLCDEIEDAAQAIGAVNTVSIKNGRLVGMNTDAFGFVQNIIKTYPRFDFKAGPAVVLGSGGAARGVVYGLLKQGVPKIYVVNRTRARAENIAAMSAVITPVSWEERSKILAGARMIVNTTSLGMVGQPPLELDLSILLNTVLVCDIVYTPLYTPLLKQVRSRGNPVVTGIGMLLQQARPAFEAWFGVMPEVDKNLEARLLQ